MALVPDNPGPKIMIILSRAYRSIADFLESGLVMNGIPSSDFWIVEVLLHKGPLAISAIAQKAPVTNAAVKKTVNRLRHRKEIAKLTGLSESQFGRAFKLSMGISPHKWLIGMRIFEAQELLKEGRLSLAEIAIATGFAEQSHFTRVFKEIVGVSPGIWHRQNRA